jgi:hypothetical protein
MVFAVARVAPLVYVINSTEGACQSLRAPAISAPYRSSQHALAMTCHFSRQAKELHSLQPVRVRLRESRGFEREPQIKHMLFQPNDTSTHHSHTGQSTTFSSRQYVHFSSDKGAHLGESASVDELGCPEESRFEGPSAQAFNLGLSGGPCQDCRRSGRGDL